MKKIIRSAATIHNLKNILSKYNGSYAKFSSSQSGSYRYSNEIGVRVCPYCNINYTQTVHKPKRCKSWKYRRRFVCRPDFDHFVPKSKGGSELCIDNLVPCCQQCNSRVKGATPFSQTTHIHPFFDDFDSIKKFSIHLKSVQYLDRSSFDIIFKRRQGSDSDDKRANKFIYDLMLNERYQFHKEEVVVLLQKIKYYQSIRRSEVEELLGSRNLFSVLFQTYGQDINKTPLGKLHNDIIDMFI